MSIAIFTPIAGAIAAAVEGGEKVWGKLVQKVVDEAELAELLKPVEAEYETLRAKFGATQGPGLTTTGAPRSPNTTAAIKDIMNMSMQDKIRAFASAGRK